MDCQETFGSDHLGGNAEHKVMEDINPVAPTTAKQLFTRELCCMMFGFGDDRNPYRQTVNMLEDLVLKYIGEIAQQANQHRQRRANNHDRLEAEDIMFVVRKDAKKLARVRDLITMNLELKQARKAFDEVQYAQSQGQSSPPSSLLLDNNQDDLGQNLN